MYKNAAPPTDAGQGPASGGSSGGPSGASSGDPKVVDADFEES